MIKIYKNIYGIVAFDTTNFDPTIFQASLSNKGELALEWVNVIN